MLPPYHYYYEFEFVAVKSIYEQKFAIEYSYAM